MNILFISPKKKINHGHTERRGAVFTLGSGEGGGGLCGYISQPIRAQASLIITLVSVHQHEDNEKLVSVHVYMYKSIFYASIET